MDRQTAKEFLPMLQAFIDGKQIQASKDKRDWTDTDELGLPDRNYFRIKPEPKLRPYTFDEMGRELKKHGGYVTMDGKSIKSIILINGDYVKFGCGGCASLTGLYNQFVWLDDGSPCGVMEE